MVTAINETAGETGSTDTAVKKTARVEAPQYDLPLPGIQDVPIESIGATPPEKTVPPKSGPATDGQTPAAPAPPNHQGSVIHRDLRAAKKFDAIVLEVPDSMLMEELKNLRINEVAKEVCMVLVIPNYFAVLVCRRITKVMNAWNPGCEQRQFYASNRSANNKSLRGPVWFALKGDPDFKVRVPDGTSFDGLKRKRWFKPLLENPALFRDGPPREVLYLDADSVGRVLGSPDRQGYVIHRDLEVAKSFDTIVLDLPIDIGELELKNLRVNEVAKEVCTLIVMKRHHPRRRKSPNLLMGDVEPYIGGWKFRGRRRIFTLTTKPLVGQGHGYVCFTRKGDPDFKVRVPNRAYFNVSHADWWFEPLLTNPGLFRDGQPHDVLFLDAGSLRRVLGSPEPPPAKRRKSGSPASATPTPADAPGSRPATDGRTPATPAPPRVAPTEPAVLPVGAADAGKNEPPGRPGHMLRYVPPDQLTPYPVNAEIYGDKPGADMVESVRELGVLQPLLVTPKNVILVGNMRHAASLEAGLTEVQVITVDPPDDNAAVEMLLAANRQRVKSNEQTAREVSWQMKIEREKARQRQAAAGPGKPVPAKSPEAIGDAREIVAKKVKIGVKKVDQCVTVIEKLDQLTTEGNDDEAQDLRRILDKSVNKASNRVKILNLRQRHGVTPAPKEQAETPAKETKADVITRLQENLADGIEEWSLETLLLFEKDLPALKANWEKENLEKEVA